MAFHVAHQRVEMAFHVPPHGACIPRRQRRDHAAVIGQHPVRIRALPRRHEADAPQARKVFTMGPGQRRVVARRYDQPVHLHVQVEDLDRVAAGETVVDPEVVRQLLGRRRGDGPLGSLTDREREVLALMAEGRTNGSIAEVLVVSEAGKLGGRRFGSHFKAAMLARWAVSASRRKTSGRRSG